MSLVTTTFWKLLEESRLLTAEQVRQLVVDFSQSGGSATGQDAKELAEWLVSRNVLSRYQATILMAGRSGPFLYGEYSVYERIDRGRLAGSFRAVHRPTGHPVLLHFLTGPVVNDPGLWAVAAHLALAGCTIQSPHVQRFLEPVDLGAFKFLVGEDLRGSSLEDRVAGGRAPVAEVCRWVRMAAIGLAQMHQFGRIHGDVRPANLWLESPAGSYPSNLKVLFEPHVVVGPLSQADYDPAGRLSLMADYLAPELAHSGVAPSPLTDIYALGCTLYSLLAGSPPFAGGSVQQKLLRHATEPIRPLEQFGVGQPLAQLVAFMMAKNPAVRFQAAAIVAEQLTPFVDPQVVYLPPPPSPATLPGYEAWVRQKQTQLAAPPPAPPPKPAPRIDLNIGSAAARSTSGPAAATPSSYQAARKRQRLQLVIGSVAAAIVLLAGGIFLVNWLNSKSFPIGGDEVAANTSDGHDGGDNESTGQTGEDGNKAAVKNTSTDVAGGGKTKTVEGAESSSATIVDDDGKLLWASPTAGQPVAFRLVPPEGQAFLIARPADILKSHEGPKVLEALGPDFASRRSAWEQAAGVTLEQVEQLIVGLHNNDGQFPRVSFVVRTKGPISKDELLQKWGQPQEQKEGSATWYAGKEWAYYVSGDSQDANAFLMAALADVKEVAKVGGAPPALMRDVERLRRSTDAQRHFTLLCYPPFLFNDDGRPLFDGPRAKVRQPLARFLGDGLQAAQISMHFGDSFYFEMRMLGSLDKEKYALASEFRDRLKAVPAELENYMDRLTPPAYWSKLARRYPLMVGALHANMRIGVESDEAVVNCYLEGPAAHSLVLGGELLVASAPGAAAALAGPVEPAGPKNIEEVLALKTSMSFGAQSLEFAMRDIADDVRANLLKGSPVEFEIKLMGRDMEKDGITRNQTISDFKQENKTVGEVLTAMVMKANSPNVPDPSMPGQKLIWVVASDPDKPQRQIVLITTRAAAERDKLKVPAPFLPKSG
jgi:serine/threonine protein kinase